MNIKELIKRIEYRIIGQKEWLMKEAPEIFTEQRHTIELDDGPTIERIYWHYGYRVALMDILEQLKDVNE